MAIRTQIGETAGRVWKLLDREGPQSLAQIKKKIDAKGDLVPYALGWLAREGQVEFLADKKGYRVART